MFEVYKDAAGEWRWRLNAGNGRIVAESGEGYRRRHLAVGAVEKVRKLSAGARVIEALEMGEKRGG